jgi:heme exporter protein C
MSFWQYSSPQYFYPLAKKMAIVFFVLASILTVCGLYIGFFVAPTDFQQGDSYLIMSFWAAVGLIMNTRLSSMLAQALAPTGALMTFIALWTGAFWGRPTWGAWWVWDARLTSELILLFLYIGYMALRASIEDPRRADRASAILALVGVVNVPIIYFSVKWWNTLHQGASVSFTKSSSMATSMLTGMLVMALAFWMYSIAVSLVRVRRIIRDREANAGWLTESSGVT